MVSKTNVKKPPGGILPEQLRAGSHVGNYSGVVRSSNLSPNLENTAAISKSTFGIKQQKKEEIKKSKNMPQGLFQSPSKGSTGVSGIKPSNNIGLTPVVAKTEVYMNPPSTQLIVNSNRNRLSNIGNFKKFNNSINGKNQYGITQISSN